MKKKIIFISVIAIIFIIIIILIKINYKKINLGNNKSNKSANEVKEYILNINSYTAELEVTINSNKNTNKYILKQEYISGNIEKQTVIKPENIKGIEIIYKDGNIEINNSKLNLSKIYNNYPYLSNNVMWLNSFIDNCKKNPENLNVYEENEYIVMELNLISNKYMANRKLYLEKGTGKPKKMIVQDDNKKDVIYILYKEIELNKN
ncbi:MAG: hypothetical protein J6K42_02820 [Clostridia bacterium]|nr:hypothetical protein [Clostridia bacterium]